MIPLVTERAYMPKAKSQEWETPRDLFDSLWEEFGGFDLDPCCRPEQYTAQRVMANNGTIYVPDGLSAREISGATILVDGLAQPWRGKVYMNPPYGREIVPWIERAVAEVENGNAEEVVALLPVRTDVKWWQQYVMTEAAVTEGHTFLWRHRSTRHVRFIKGRLRFVGAEQGATFPSAIVVWRR